MYSQKWLNESVWYSSQHEDSIWWHWVVMVVPRNFNDENMKNKAYMQIEGRGNGGPPNVKTDLEIVAAKLLAVSGGMVSAVVFQIPNQRLYFYDDWWYNGGQPMGRKEDQLCSYTWRLFMDDLKGAPMPDGAKGWGNDMVIYLPMTKAAVRGLVLQG